MIESAAHRCRSRRKDTAGRIVALYVTLSRPVRHGGEGRRLFLRPRSRDRGGDQNAGGCARQVLL